eukprot:TRINITY_DN17361_c0_g1_i4.p1 TRINITY_DN17361_c0_g1~~TRINITY_DN17361_c0_g1_i4.p1  ORF type:complete len:108 (+),score=9.42 TRINITY_DN17361_c0_g1_i4:958-1281(+)
MERYDVIPVKFNGNNYMAWSFHLKNFVEGQGLFGYLDESITKPTTISTTDTKALSTWSKENAKVITWVLNSIDLLLPLLFKHILQQLICELISRKSIIKRIKPANFT